MRKLCVLKYAISLLISLSKTNTLRYPEELADKSWDNTGCEYHKNLVHVLDPCFGSKLTVVPVLLESPIDPLRRQMNSVLLTVDLTKAVADEAIERNDSIIIAYRPWTTSFPIRIYLTELQA